MQHELDYASNVGEQLLEDCNKVIAQAALQCEQLNAENQRLREALAEARTTKADVESDNCTAAVCPPAELTIVEERPWYQEWLDMQNSWSWKLTKPLRLIEKVFKLFVKTGG